MVHHKLITFNDQTLLQKERCLNNVLVTPEEASFRLSGSLTRSSSRRILYHDWCAQIPVIQHVVKLSGEWKGHVCFHIEKPRLQS